MGYEGQLAVNVEINQRAPKGTAPLVIDGEPFPYFIDKAYGVKVQASDDNVHLVIIAIQVDHNVTVTDHTASAHHLDQSA